MLRFFKRRAMRRIREKIRVHSAIIRTTADLENYRLCGHLEDAGFPAPQDALNGFVPAEFHEAARTCLRQRTLAMNFLFLLAETGKHVARPGTPLAMPVPARWRNHLRTQGLNITWQSKLRFCLAVLDSLLRGFRTIRLLILAQSRQWLILHPTPRCHVFIQVTANTLPDPDGRQERRNLHHWYKTQFGLSDDFPFLAEDRMLDAPRQHGEGGVVAPRHFPPLEPSQRRAFIANAVPLALKAAIGTMFGRWWLAVMLEEVVQLAYFRQVPEKHLAERYLFHMGDCMVRPLWTHDVERRGSHVAVAFYATNFITFTRDPAVEASRYPGYALMSWPKLICNDEVSRKTLVGYGLADDTVSVSRMPIDFLDNGAALPAVTKPVVILFDVTPYRPYFKATRGYHIAYYNVETCIRFIQEIVDSARKHGWTVALKTKRANNRFDAPAYAQHINRLVAASGVTVIDAGTSASRAIEIADAVVSMPFSSPSVNAAARGLPSAYYDPGGQVSHHKELSRGLPIHTSAEELDAWFAALNEKRIMKRSVG